MTSLSWNTSLRRIVTLLVCLFQFLVVISQDNLRLTVGEPNPPGNLNPVSTMSTSASYIGEYLYLSLLGIDKSNGEYTPVIANKLPTISNDLLTLVYELNPQARFNSGEKITPEDVVFSIKTKLNPFLRHAAHHQGILREIESVRIEDAATIVFKMRYPNPQALYLTGTFPILNHELLDPDGLFTSIPFEHFLNPKGLSPDEATQMRTMARQIDAFGSSLTSYDPDAVSGPYLITEWVRGEKIVLTANRKYWARKISGPLPQQLRQDIDEIVFRLAPRKKDLRSDIFNQRIDIARNLPAALFYELSEIPSLNEQYSFESKPGSAYEYIGFNMRSRQRNRHPALEEEMVRKAFANMINVDLYQARFNFGYGKRLVADYPTQFPEYQNDRLKFISHDLEAAEKLLDEAGWADHNGDGLRDKAIEGELVGMAMEVIYNEENQQRRKIAEAMQQAFLKKGIVLSVRGLPMSEYIQRLETGDFDLYIGAWASDPNENSYRQIWHTEGSNGGSNFVGFGTPETDALIEHYDRLTDADARIALSHVIQQKIYEAQPYVFLWIKTQHFAVKRHQKFTRTSLAPGFWLNHFGE